MKKFLLPLMKFSSCLALMLTVLNVNSACLSIAHQPKLPEAAMKYKK